MTRPKTNRLVKQPPVFTEFKPSGIRGKDLDTVVLSLDEYEAIRLADNLGLNHEEAAERMDISRPTFSRLIDKARTKLAKMIIEGKRLVIEGGNIHFKKNLIKCIDCGEIFESNLSDSIKSCVYCNSSNITNLAKGFGHGKCCIKSSY